MTVGRKCAFMYRVGYAEPRPCGNWATKSSEFCIWHDEASKERVSNIAQLFETAWAKNQLVSPEGICLRKAPLRGLVLVGGDLQGIDFEGADLTRAKLRGSNISQCIFKGATLRGADLSECSAIGADFEGACLDEANCRGANLSGARFDRAEIRGTILKDANIANTVLTRAQSDEKFSESIYVKKYSPNPFTPKAGVPPMCFGGREKNKKLLMNTLNAGMHGDTDHIIVTGDWAMGKTSLLLWYRSEIQHQGIWTSYVPIPLCSTTAPTKDSVESIIEGIYSGFAMGVSKMKKFLKTLESFGFSIAGTGLTFSRCTDLSPMSMLYQALTSLWEDVSDGSGCVVIMLDDVHQLGNATEVMSAIQQCMVLITVNRSARILLVLASTSTEWNAIAGSSGHTPIGRYFSTPGVELRKLTASDVRIVVEKTLENTGVSFSENILSEVIDYAAGHPYDLQIICKLLYDAQMQGVVRMSAWDKAKCSADMWLNRVATKQGQAPRSSDGSQ